MTDPLWIVGAGGLLGQALLRRTPNSFLGRPIPWSHPEEAGRALEVNALRYAETSRDRWTVVWAAGAAVVATDEAAADRELEQFRSAVTAIRRHLPGHTGVFFLSSSAGGIYAGSSRAPFDENSQAAPLSAYGRLKLAMEQVAIEVLGDHCHVVLGRLSNLYGAGQNLDKPQGLISQLCYHTLTRRALSVYVSLETMRDYLYVDDAASLVSAAIGAARERAEIGASVRVLASGEPATVARLVGLLERQYRHRPLLSMGVHPSSAFQVRDLRLRTLYGHEQRGAVRTTLAVGLAQVLRHMSQLLRDGAFAAASGRTDRPYHDGRRR